MKRLRLQTSGDAYTATILTSARGIPTARIRGQRTRKVLTSITLALCALMIALMASVAPREQAQAGPLDISGPLKDMFCGGEAYFNAPQPRSVGMAELGITLMTPGVLAGADAPAPVARSLGEMVSGDATLAQRPHTAYERFGTSGTLWTVYRGGVDKDEINNDSSRVPVTDEKTDLRTSASACQPVFELGGTYAANSILTVTKMLVEATNFIISQSIFVPFIEQLGELTVEIVGELRTALYLPFINLVILIGALWAGWVGIVKKQNMVAAQAFAWMLGASVIGSVLMANPAALISGVATIHTTVSTAVLSNLGSGAQQSDGMCSLPAPAKTGSQAANDAAASETLVRTVGCDLWKSFVYFPWHQGQWGKAPEQMPQNDDHNVSLGPGRTASGLGISQVQSMVLTDDVLSGGRGTDANTARWNVIVDDVMTSENEEIIASWSGSNPTSRITISLASVLIAAGALSIVAVLGIFSILLALSTSILLMILPICCLAGAHPGLGKRIAQQYLEILLGLLIKRAIVVILMSVSLTVYAYLMKMGSGSGSFIGSIFLTLMFSCAMMLYRKKIVNLFGNVDLGSGRDNTEWTAPSAQTLKKASGAVVGAGVGLAAGGLAGAAGGATKGVAMSTRVKTAATSALKAGAKGGAQGARSGKGIRSGVSAGRSTAQNAKQKAQAGAQSQARTEEREAQRAAKTQAASDARTAKQQEREQSPEYMAKQRRDENMRIKAYRRDYAENINNPEWVEAFERKYGMPPVDPNTHDFPGYGRSQYNAATEHPRPRTQERPAPKPGGDKPAGESSGGNSGPKMNKENAREGGPERSTPRPGPEQPQSAPRPGAEQSAPRPGSMPKPEKATQGAHQSPDQPASTSMPRPASSTSSTSAPGGTTGTRESQQPPTGTQRAGGMPRPGGK